MGSKVRAESSDSSSSSSSEEKELKTKVAKVESGSESDSSSSSGSESDCNERVAKRARTESSKKASSKKASAKKAESDSDSDSDSSSDSDNEEQNAKTKSSDAKVEEEAVEEAVESKVEEPAAEAADETPVEVFVGGLSFRCTEDDLRRDFAECGEVTNARILLNEEQRSKGVGFVAFASKAGADKAILWNETEYMGRTIRVNEAGGRPEKGKGKGKGSAGKPEGCRSVVVKDLPASATDEELWAAFEGCGDLRGARIHTHRDTGLPSGLAFVDFHDGACVDEAMKIQYVGENAVRVDYSRPKEPKGEGKGKGFGKDGKGKGKGDKGKGKGKGAPMAARGSIQDYAGEKKTFADSDDE